MQFKFFTAAFVVCMTALVSAAPVPVLVAPAGLEARDVADELNIEVAREPVPVCAKYQCW
ncbi:hypothetical protein HYPSUDRAFT_66816 [Hypholoma sublateritium FD-334 SS-4]|uniref:Uncharacterized protein n=1 Tax=Hypholoma sublateritium (strain FD-334 SS-4) TaxID=945553 RepID=A0A0D2MGT4_HYPSF|nr:hypothetical protein HYPSUDRAFT_66816 [Hypholoma sublateritium FD-334 SS-4]